MRKDARGDLIFGKEECGSQWSAAVGTVHCAKRPKHWEREYGECLFASRLRSAKPSQSVSNPKLIQPQSSLRSVISSGVGGLLGL